jgi:hypothetical protein
LRRRFGDSVSAVRLPGGYTIPAVAGVLCAGLLVQVSPLSVAATAALLAIGLALFALARSKSI